MTTSGVMGEQVEEGEVNYESLHTAANLDGNLAAVKGAKSNSSSALKISTAGVESTGTLTKGTNQFSVTTTGTTTVQNMAALAGNVNTTSTITNMVSAVAANITHGFADGEEGQLKYLRMTTDNGNDVIVQPTNFYDGTSLTFNTADQECWLIFVNGAWMVITKNKNVSIQS
tara:strand:- start:144 stop:659 length:516 start_codon:yes stop_codon:yes gene_type:complete